MKLITRLVTGAVALCAGFGAFTDVPAAVCATATAHVDHGGAPLQSATGTALAVAARKCVPEGSDAHWIARGGVTVTLLAEFSPFKNRNVFGIYDPTDPSRRLELFNGWDGAGTQTLLAFIAGEGGYQVVATTGSYTRRLMLEGPEFGFYLTTPQRHGQTYFSDTTLNPDGVDHMYAYTGTGAAFYGCALPAAPRGQWFGRDTYLLAWEDLLRGGDRDYQDMIVAIRNIAAVPLPSALGLFAAGIVGIGLMRRAGVTKR